jgi:hypothetical protein
VVRTTKADPVSRRDTVRRGPPPPARPFTGMALAVLLGGMFIAAVLVIAVKAFGAAGHPMLGLFVGLACLLSSGFIYWRTSKKRS